MPIVEFVAGLLIVALVLFDVFQTVVLPRPTPVTFRPSGRLIAGLYVLWLRVALRSPKRREQVLGMFAPQMVVVVLVYWGLGLVLGYGLVLYALRDQVH